MYEVPEMEIIEFEFENVDTLTASEVSDGTNEGNTNVGGIIDGEWQ